MCSKLVNSSLWLLSLFKGEYINVYENCTKKKLRSSYSCKYIYFSNYLYAYDVANYGNTVSNSIPIALKDLLAAGDSAMLRRVMILGFGVGLSWGGCMVDLTKINLVHG